MADSPNVSPANYSWANAQKTEGNYQPSLDYVKMAKEIEAEKLSKTSLFTYAASYRG